MSSSPRPSNNGPMFGPIPARWRGEPYSSEAFIVWERTLLQALKDYAWFVHLAGQFEAIQRDTLSRVDAARAHVRELAHAPTPHGTPSGEVEFKTPIGKATASDNAEFDPEATIQGLQSEKAEQTQSRAASREASQVAPSPRGKQTRDLPTTRNVFHFLERRFL